MPKRAALVASLAALALTVGASPAQGAVTIGQTASSTLSCASGIDRLQPSVTSGNGYVVPATGGVSAWTITSWSTLAKAGAGQALTMKVYRPLGGATYQVVGHNGPHRLNPDGLNTFPADVAVKPGDVLGVSTPADAGLPACHFSAPDTYLIRAGQLADGSSGDFTDVGGDPKRLNISAVIAQVNSFTFGKAKLNTNKGTASLLVDVPNPGQLTGSGKGVKVAGVAGAVSSKSVKGPGTAKLTITAKGKKKRTLDNAGKVKVKTRVTFTPTGGDPKTLSKTLTLKKR